MCSPVWIQPHHAVEQSPYQPLRLRVLPPRHGILHGIDVGPMLQCKANCDRGLDRDRLHRIAALDRGQEDLAHPAVTVEAHRGRVGEALMVVLERVLTTTTRKKLTRHDKITPAWISSTRSCDMALELLRLTSRSCSQLSMWSRMI